MLRTMFRCRQPLDEADRRNTAACPASLRRRDVASLAHSVPRQRKNATPGSVRARGSLRANANSHQNHARQAPIRSAILPPSGDAPDWGTYRGHTGAREGEAERQPFREMRNFDEKLRNSLALHFPEICFYKTHARADKAARCLAVKKVSSGKPTTSTSRFTLSPPITSKIRENIGLT